MNRIAILTVKVTNRTRSRMKKIFPIVLSPSKMKGCCAITTAIEPVLIVHANHGHVNRESRSVMERWWCACVGDAFGSSDEASVSWRGFIW